MNSLLIAGISVGISFLSALISIAAILVSRQTAQQLKASDEAVDRRKFVTTLWDKMTQVEEINPTQPNEKSVQNALNTLELISLCWTNNLVDKKMIVMVFGDTFVLRHGEIQRVPKLPVIQRTGAELLQKDYPSIGIVAAEIQTELNKKL